MMLEYYAQAKKVLDFLMNLNFTTKNEKSRKIIDKTVTFYDVAT